MAIEKKLREKHAYGFTDLHQASNIPEYSKYVLDLCKEQEYSKKTLSELFFEYFQKFTGEMFDKVPSVTRFALREYLCINGVYVTKRRGLKLPTAFMKVINDDPK